MVAVLQPPPLALYVHLPWCVRKCPYCDFNSHTAPDQIPQRDYVKAILEDLDHDLSVVAGRRLESIFFGGGTPSLFSPEEIGRFLEGVAARFGDTGRLEVTLEANPGTIEHGRFRGYRDAGVTRVSLGAQSFNDRHLKVLGRIHGTDDIARAVDELSQAGLENFNLDLMYGLPEQTREEALADLRSAIELRPRHLSHYQLTLEPGTVFYHRPPPLPDHDATWDMQVDCQALLAAHGYQQYEVSAYAQAGSRCTHNLNYWTFGDYIGVGAGAHGKLTNAGAVERTTRHRQPREYLSRAVADRLVERRIVAAAELPFEYMLNALRLRDGFDLAHFELRTGLPRSAIAQPLKLAGEKRLLEEVSPGFWKPTDFGARFLNELHGLFLPD
ncbi:oxygen-independent coproporphyrinogen-3 oxidase [Povalibacter uvarum]|uniref:Heme chaperone HemW n=1 Tax=Povalibacter uvarum TaxID=732238 RepID=A0A841HLL2_9GAMM|nr:radical SAM family heme chaperone HemW [Povalibacter uvarum]MBB6092992.1 oxygen-independent coproporphyrinogen-3 oxidase [Povalibacter uvarum]